MQKKKNYIFFCLFCCLISLSGQLYAQKPTVRATIQPSDILIGEQAVIDVEVIAPKGRNIIFPLYTDTLITGIEVLKMFPPDTVMTEVMTISQKYLVTSFDSTLYHIPQMLVIDGNDTIRSNDFGLKVSAPQLSDSTLAYLELLKTQQTDSIDFEKLQINDIKDIQTPPFVWQDYLGYILIPALILLLLAAIAVAVFLFLKKRKKGYYFKPKVILPPHVIALNGLDELKNSKMWQRGLEKQFYTQLTDILREYIDKRFGIDAPEMTSDEIVTAIHRNTDVTSTTDNLKQILTLADLVKFAKYTPPTEEVDLSLINAYLFVNQTKIEEVKPLLEGEEAQEAAAEPANEKENNKANS